MKISNHERRQAFRNMRRHLETLETLEARLVAVIRNPPLRPDAPDGYPRGGDGSGASHGMSDPTLATVEARLDRAQAVARRLTDETWRSVIEAERHLAAACSSALRALDVPKPVELPDRPAQPAWWCTSCARQWPGTQQAVAFNARTATTKRSRADLCSWCLDRWEASNDDPKLRKLPDIRLVIWRADHANRYVTASIEKQALAEPMQDVRERAPRPKQESA